MTETVLTKYFEAPPVDKNEILRYAGGGKGCPENILDECISELFPHLSYSVCYMDFPVIKKDDGSVDLSFTDCHSASASRLLKNSSRIVLFAATIGLYPDIMIMQNTTLSPLKALYFSACGSERVEALCDSFSRFYQEEYNVRLTPRFSPGYSDMPLSVQNDIFANLNPEKKIGVTLNGSLLMTPTKSVTAFAGIIDDTTQI